MIVKNNPFILVSIVLFIIGGLVAMSVPTDDNHVASEIAHTLSGYLMGAAIVLFVATVIVCTVIVIRGRR
jgi:hypothetical protein